MIQPLAYIHPEAKIADNVVIEPFVTIYKNVEIGEGTWIGPNVTIMEAPGLGKAVKFFPVLSYPVFRRTLNSMGKKRLLK